VIQHRVQIGTYSVKKLGGEKDNVDDRCYKIRAMSDDDTGTDFGEEEVSKKVEKLPFKSVLDLFHRGIGAHLVAAAAN